MIIGDDSDFISYRSRNELSLETRKCWIETVKHKTKKLKKLKASLNYLNSDTSKKYYHAKIPLVHLGSSARNRIYKLKINIVLEDPTRDLRYLWAEQPGLFAI